MKSRRDFISQSAAAGLVLAAQAGVANALQKIEPRGQAGGRRLKKFTRREETLRRLGGCGAPSAPTWSKDGRQIFSMLDGTGFDPKPKKVYHDRLFSISGSPSELKFEEMNGFPEQLAWANPKLEEYGYFGSGTLAIGDHIYHFMGSMSGPWMSAKDGTFVPFHIDGTKLVYSPDKGKTWFNQDGSAPVIWESWNKQERDHMLFFKEAGPGVLGGLTLLQMGQGYSLNRDGYVYGYSKNGAVADYVAVPETYGNPNEILLVRVPKSKILDRNAYEFFKDIDSDGAASWTKSVSERGVVWTLPKGGGLASAVYNAPLGLYMMMTEHDGGIGKPSGLGLWTAPTPWGPFEKVSEEAAWTLGGDTRARAKNPQIMPKWIADDGLSFWLVWFDMMHTDGSEGVSSQQELFRKYLNLWTQEEQVSLFLEWQRRIEPYFSFNMQKVDLVLA